ncbi:hypothetical protein DNTS_020248 [Danionella cerebrum]|uniref:C2H2-type domain-containing protein n=1 Tax=Danionella cerebrum TaxID=2873325 RepID=A0A553NW72_9TELE|nr:hypothetical protein DNTS_020248 [Danionella translucida]TRY69687.1 hypothetical protein DNTS_020248 [Danionella translucida]
MCCVAGILIHVGMGEMKTPDFDDLLAAFDIPDIDAKEAIQSDADGDHNERCEVAEKERRECPESPPLALHNDSSIVSVIVKNSVRAEQNPEENGPGDVSSAGASQLSSSEDSLVPSDPFIRNGLQSISDGAKELCPLPALRQMQPNGPQWPISSSRDVKQDAIFRNLTPLQSLSLTESPILSTHLHSPTPNLSCGLFSETSKPALRVGVRRQLSEDEESEPDLGSPALVIHESPDSQLCPAPKVPRVQQSPSSVFQPPSPSSPSLPVSNIQIKESSIHQPTLLQSNLPVEERDLEHIIEERDSPESPEPEVPQTSLLSNQKASNESEQETRREDQDTSPQIKTEGNGAEVIEMKSPEPSLEDPSSEDLKISSTAMKTLKARDKTKATPRKIKRTPSKVGTSKSQAGARKSVKKTPRYAGSPQLLPLGSKVESLPISILQEASTAMLFAASKAQKQMTSSLSATAVNITKSSTLPPISSSLLGANPRSSGQKLNPGTVKAASIVSSSGAVISRNQTSLVETFNKILNSKNPLPSYHPDLSTPPPCEWGLHLPSTGYRCLECGDAFALERSLARHYDRRSIRIEVTCNHCSKRLAFFNKCSLLLHAREHKEKGLVMQCSHLVMSPVSVEQMIGQQDPVPIALLSPTASAVKDNATQSADHSCPECQMPFKAKAELAEHFQEESAGHDPVCMQCSPPMVLWNPCSAAAHHRLHQQLPPLVCPECGSTCQNQDLRVHLNQSCRHYSRRLGYKCACCHLVFGGVNSLNAVKSHMQTAHCEVFHKCPSCPMAFKSASGAEAHCTAQHPELPETAREAKEIYKCVMCRTVFTQKTLLSVHVDSHLAKQKTHVFKCPHCSKLFTQRGSLFEHIKDAHRDMYVHEAVAQVKMESSDGEDWDLDEDEGREREAGSSAAAHSQSWSCSPCKTRFTRKENYISHMSEQHGKDLKKFPCTLCERSFSSSSSLRRHIRVKHKGIKRAFYCQLCTDGRRSFSSKLVLEKHIQAQHRGVRVEHSQAGACVTDAADSSSEHDASTLGRTSLDAGSRLAGASDGVKETAAGFRCMPCGFSTEDREEFLQHIASHREGCTTFQCQQCGACFASSSSLSRHLFISHRVRGSPSDRTKSSPITASPCVSSDPAFAGGSPGSPSGAGGSQADEGEGRYTCKVCRRNFSRAADLNTHFRTHGMAFIRAYKTDKPPENDRK